MQRVFFLGCGFVRLGRGGIDLGGLCGVELGVELDAGVIGEFAEQFVHGVFRHLLRCRLGDGVLVYAVVDGVLFVLLLELLESQEGLHDAMG